jgi:hypothetical protein
MNTFNETTGLNPSQPTQSNFAQFAQAFGQIGAESNKTIGIFTNVAGVKSQEQKLQDGERAIMDAQNATAIDLAKLGNVGKQIQADAVIKGWDAQKIIQELQLKGVINTNEANKAIAKAQQYAATYAAVANTVSSKASVANTKIAQEAANKRVIYWLAGVAVLGVLGFIGFVFYKTKIKE